MRQDFSRGLYIGVLITVSVFAARTVFHKVSRAIEKQKKTIRVIPTEPG